MRLSMNTVDITEHDLPARRPGKAAEGTAPTRPRREDAITLPDSVWADFATNWEKLAGVLPGVLPRPLVYPELLFDALVRAARLRRLGVPSVAFSFWINARETKDLGELLPGPEDKSLAGYDARLADQLRGAEFTLLLANPHLYCNKLWDRVRVFIRGLYRQVGVPCGGVDTGIFLGRYLRTPFGVHRGQMSVLTFPVYGEKHFRLWPRGYGDAHEDIRDSLEYPDHISNSLELRAGEQDMLYWPADYWHIAESAGSFTAALNLGCWWDRPPLSRVLLEVSQQLAERMDGVGNEMSLDYARAVSGEPQEFVPAQMAEALSVIRQTVSDDRIEEALALETLRTLSADGFRDLPEPLPFESPRWRGEVIERIPERPVLSMRGADGTLHVAANGRLFSAGDSARLRRLLKGLELGEKVKLDDSVAKAAGVPELLRWLLGVGAIRVLSDAGADQ